MGFTGWWRDPRRRDSDLAVNRRRCHFSEAVTDSLKAASSAAGVDLIVLDNRYDGATALRNADEFVRNRVDLVIEFQIDQHVAPVLADKIDAAGIPLIAVDIPHPHATFFGVNNYRVGFEAGECLAQYAKRSWGGKVRWALGLDIDEAGPLVRSRVTGAFEAIRSRLPGIPAEFLVRWSPRIARQELSTGDSIFCGAIPRIVES